MKERIIAHMNKDHPDSVARYIEHLQSASRLTSRSAKLTDISLKSMTIQTSIKSYTVPIDPPLESWSDARTRLVQMDKESLLALNRSPITITTFVPPTNFQHITTLILTLGTFFMLSSASYIEPRGWAYTYILRYINGLPEFTQRFRLVIVGLMVLIHGGEAFYMTVKLKRHSVPIFSAIWWAWVIDNFSEGFGAFQRFDELVDDETKRREKLKH